MTKEEAYQSYKHYESYVDSEVKAGRLTINQAFRYLKESKYNYKNQNFNRQHDKRKK